MGAATALYSATCRILGHYGNGNLYPVALDAIVGLGGWLPCSRFGFYHICTEVQLLHGNASCALWLINLTHISGSFPRTLRNRMDKSLEAARRAASLPILLCHGSGVLVTLIDLIHPIYIIVLTWIINV